MNEDVPERDMAKVQKNFLLNPELAEFIDVVARLSGANFTKIATAALIQYLFHGLEHPEDDGSIGPNPTWMRYAVAIDRADISVADIPSDLIANAVDSARSILKELEADAPRSEKEIPSLKRQLRKREDAKRSWNNAVEDFENAEHAIVQRLQSCFLKPRT